MKRTLIVLAVALAAGISSFAWMRSHNAARLHQNVLLDAMPELGWLRGELHLTDAQFAEVSARHAAYLPQCAAMCRRIAEAHQRMEKAARAEGGVSPELDAAIFDHAKVHAECQRNMLAHLYGTARLMDEKQGARYLEVMLPYALDFSHSEPDHAHIH